jgi:hypothetical protein
MVADRQLNGIKLPAYKIAKAIKQNIKNNSKMMQDG